MQWQNIGNSNNNSNCSSDKSLDGNLYRVALIAMIICIIIIAIIKLLDIPINKYLMPCMFHELTGGYCPGCGGTRAIQYLLKGQIIKSLYYNPFVVYAFVIFSYYMISNTVYYITRRKFPPMRYRSLYCYTAIVIVIGNFIWKNYMYFFKGVALIP